MGAVVAKGTSPDVTAAAMRCIARWGLAKTTFDDIAREVGISRATLYRSFSGGKEALVAAVAADEAGRQVDGLVVEFDAATTLEDLLVAALLGSWRRIEAHQALQFLVAHEPETVLPAVSFDGFDRLLSQASMALAPSLRRFLDHDNARRTGEWLTRVVITFALTPSSHLDLNDDASVRRFVSTFLLPGLVPSEPTSMEAS